MRNAKRMKHHGTVALRKATFARLPSSEYKRVRRRVSGEISPSPEVYNAGPFPGAVGWVNSSVVERCLAKAKAEGSIPFFRSVLSPHFTDQSLYTGCRALRFKRPTKAVNAGGSLRFQAWIDGGLHQEHSLSCCQRQAGRSTCI